MVYVSCGLGLAFLVAFLAVCFRQRSVFGVALKTLTSVCFMMTAGFSLIKNPEASDYGVLVIIGLLFGLLGDIALDLKWVYPKDDSKYLVMGFTTFAVGHLFYITAIMGQAGLTAKNLLIPAAAGVVVAVGNLLLEKPMKQDFGRFRPIVTAYGFILALSAATAVYAAVASGFKTEWAVFAVGGVLFLLSDLVLSPMYFAKGKNTPANFVINHVLYYAAQYCIAITVLLLGK